MMERLQKQETKSEIIDDISNYPKGEFLDRVVVKDRHKINIIPVDRIRYFESMDDYVLVYTKDGRHLKQKTMKYFENALNPKEFISLFWRLNILKIKILLVVISLYVTKVAEWCLKVIWLGSFPEFSGYRISV